MYGEEVLLILVQYVTLTIPLLAPNTLQRSTATYLNKLLCQYTYEDCVFTITKQRKHGGNSSW